MKTEDLKLEKYSAMDKNHRIDITRFRNRSVLIFFHNKFNQDRTKANKQHLQVVTGIGVREQADRRIPTTDTDRRIPTTDTRPVVTAYQHAIFNFC